MPFQLVVITPDTLLSSPAAAELRVAQSLFDRGLQVLHVRKPGSSAEQVQQYLAALPPAARRRCQLHQHHLLAKQTAIHGIHYREADRPPGIIKAPPGLAVSTSFHTLEDLGVCRGEVDYCFLSPIYNSISKGPGYAAAFPDTEQLAAALAGARYPVIALGGVTPDRFGELADLGFAGAALLGAVWQAADPLAAFERAQREAERL